MCQNAFFGHTWLMTERGSFVTPAPGEDLESYCSARWLCVEQSAATTSIVANFTLLGIGGTVIRLSQKSLRTEFYCAKETRGRWARAGTGAQSRIGQIPRGSAPPAALRRAPPTRPPP